MADQRVRQTEGSRRSVAKMSRARALMTLASHVEAARKDRQDAPSRVAHTDEAADCPTGRLSVLVTSRARDAGGPPMAVWCRVQVVVALLDD